jgi:hypothetical protein
MMKKISQTSVIPTKVGTQNHRAGAQLFGSVLQLLGPDFRRDDCFNSEGAKICSS